MKPYPRIRKTIKWGGLAATVLLLAIWISSAWYHAEWSGANGYSATVAAGRVGVRRASPAAGAVPPAWWPQFSRGRGFKAQRQPPHLLWLPSWVDKDEPFPVMMPDGPFTMHIVALGLPLWIPVLLVTAPTAVSWRRDIIAHRRIRAGGCPRCGYERRGLASGAVCPECGGAETKPDGGHSPSPPPPRA